MSSTDMLLIEKELLSRREVYVLRHVLSNHILRQISAP